MSEFPIFSVLGIEIEYMLVDKNTLDVQPKSDLILKTLAGEQVNEVELGDIAISNELVMHVLEFKTQGPKRPEEPISAQFQAAIKYLQPKLDELDLILLPGGAHPWMNPHKETIRWPHDQNDIYDKYHDIFDCRGHGWANLQSMHVNLPYGNEAEFFRLHNLIRLMIPLIPALAASTPILDGKSTGMLDSRLHYYEHNQKKIPSIAGDIVPEFINHPNDYERLILNPMYDAIRPFDPEGILQYPWLNSRGAIPKFDVQAIEIRIIDSQECPDADIAIAKAIHEILKLWDGASEAHLTHPIDTKVLKAIYDASCQKGLSHVVHDKNLLTQWQAGTSSEMTLRAIWDVLIAKVSHKLTSSEQHCLELILSEGNLSQRILKAINQKTNHHALFHVYQQLADCLVTNQPLRQL